MSVIVSTSGRLRSEFVRLLFLQTCRETDRFFVASGVQFTHSTNGLFHFRHVSFSSCLKAKDCLRSKLTVWKEDQVTVMPEQGITQWEKRVAQWVVKTLTLAKTGVWGCV
jgi:hypothetical protein